MSKLIKTDADYSRWIQELKDRYRCAQIKAATRVNQELLRFYWSVGRDIVARDAENKYGSGFYKNLSQDLKDALPESDGFSRQNLQYMKKMYLFYRQAHTNCQQVVGNSESEMCQQLVGDFIFLVPWGHHCTIIDTYFWEWQSWCGDILFECSLDAKFFIGVNTGYGTRRPFFSSDISKS